MMITNVLKILKNPPPLALLTSVQAEVFILDGKFLILTLRQYCLSRIQENLTD